MSTNDSNRFYDVIELAQVNLHISEYLNNAIETAIKFKKYICNSLETTLNNGRLDGKLNRIKKLNKTACGFKSF